MNPTQDKHTTALRAAIARCQELMRAAKQHGDMTTYESYLKQMYALRQQLRNTQRAREEHPE